ncbi:MAG TPA: VOC family protein [Candidatus Saccharimonadales bacterium]|jgi:PhnB protein|nr:VOC family protein [Candidatus Saccharimonadales bacterium]
MSVDPYLLFNGNCEEAFKFYEKLLGGKIVMKMTHRESPMAAQTPPEWQDKIMHIRMDVGDRVLMASDAPPGHYEKPQGFSVSVTAKDPAEAERFFNELSKNGKVIMPLGKTFWSPAFAMLVDRFAIPWMVNCNQAA